MEKFALKIYEQNPKNILILCKDSLTIIKHLRKEYPQLKKMLTHKGYSNLNGSWPNVNTDIAEFSKKYPLYLFELRRKETAVVQVEKEGVITGTEKILITIFQVLNGSINLQTFSGKEEELEEEAQIKADI